MVEHQCQFEFTHGVERLGFLVETLGELLVALQRCFGILQRQIVLANFQVAR